MILKNIKGSNIDSDTSVSTDIIEIEFLNEDNNTEFACLIREYDEKLKCRIDDAIISKESIFDIIVEAYRNPDKMEDYLIQKKNAIATYGVFRKGLYPVEMESSKYKNMILLAGMASDNIRNIDEFKEQYVNKDVDEIEIDIPNWTDDSKLVIDYIKKDFCTNDDEFKEKFESFYQTVTERVENETDTEVRLELSAFLDDHLSWIEEFGMSALDKAIEEYEIF